MADAVLVIILLSTIVFLLVMFPVLRIVNALISAGVIEDATKLWWDLRPSDRFPTLEMRMTDVCTQLDDTICVAALY